MVSRRTMLHAIQFGPHVYSVGGTQSVIRTIRDHRIGADRIDVVPTWDGYRNLHNARLVAQAAAVVLRAPRGTVTHFHISNGGAWARDGLLIKLAGARGLRVVVTLHGFEIVDFATAHRRLVRGVLRSADHVICLSEDARALISDLLGHDRVSVLANPMAIDDDSPPADQTEPVALFAGTIGIRKGVDVLSEAWRLLLEEGIEGRCRLVGPIDDFTPPALERLDVEDAVHPNDVPALLRTARVVVLPSRAEGMPMILTESLAAGRPFIATPVGGTATITPDPNMLVPVEDAPALAQAIRRYLDDPGVAGAAGRRGQEYIRSTRSPEVIDRLLRPIYEGRPA